MRRSWRSCQRSKSAKALAQTPDDRILADLTKRVFSAGFVWSVIEAKWPGFEAAFLGFMPKRLLAQPDEFWEAWRGIPASCATRRKSSPCAPMPSSSPTSPASTEVLASSWPNGLRPIRSACSICSPSAAHGLADARASSFCASSARTALCCRAMSLPACAIPASISRRTRRRRKTCKNSSDVQRLGRGDRVALHAPLAYLRHVHRRKL